MAGTDRSDSLEKGAVEVGQAEISSGEPGLTPARVPHKDDPLVCINTTVLRCSTNRLLALASFVQNLCCRPRFTPRPSWSG